MKKHIASFVARADKKKGFTLIELLIVIALLGIIMTSIIFLLNPGDARKKTRDLQRVRDLTTINTIINEWLAEGGEPPGIDTVYITNSSNNSASADCSASGWLGIDVCKFIKSVPIDPLNVSGGTIIGSPGNPTGCTEIIDNPPDDIYYYFAFDRLNRTYEVNVAQEATTNCNKTNADGGNSSLWVEAGTEPDLDLLGDSP